jgi:hypothetical protein
MNITEKQATIFPQRWAFFAGLILFLHTSLMLTAVAVFVRGGSNDVIPNFYEKAVHWDQIKAANAAAAATAGPVGDQSR